MVFITHLFIQPPYGRMDIYFILRVIIQYYVTLFIFVQIIPTLTGWLLCPSVSITVVSRQS